jgi:malate synthase
VRRDKLREVTAGHDGTWVAHPGLVAVAKEVFDAHMPTPNQIHVKREDVLVTAADLLAVPSGEITEGGLRLNIDVGIQYLESWLRGSGCVPIYNLMEDAATAEISRTQVWQWLHHGAKLNDGRQVTSSLVHETIASELEHIRGILGPQRYDSGKFPVAAEMFERMLTNEHLPEFLTLEAYQLI